MPPGSSSFLYNSIWVEKFLRTIPLRRKILARYFQRYKITQEEYEKWLFINLLKKDI